MIALETSPVGYVVDHSDDTRSRLVWAAACLVRSESYHSVGVKSICDRAGVFRGSFYHHFDSKQALMLEVLEEVWAGFAQDLAVCLDRTRPSRDRMESVIAVLHEIHLEDVRSGGRVVGCLFGNLAAESTTLDEPVRSRLESIFEEWRRHLEEPLADAWRAGELDPRISPHDASVELLAEIQGLVLLAKVNNDPEVFAAGGRSCLDRLWGASAPPLIGLRDGRTESSGGVRP